MYVIGIDKCNHLFYTYFQETENKIKDLSNHTIGVGSPLMDRSLYTHAECAYVIITYLLALSQVNSLIIKRFCKDSKKIKTKYGIIG